jgi:phosphinothricin acetyltransferase
MNALNIRACEQADIAAVTEIYCHHVLHSLATFECDPPGPEEMAKRWHSAIAHGYPYLVAERQGEVVGYAYAGPYRARPAYRYAVENSVYVRADSARQGIGLALLQALIQECERNDFRQMIAVIGDSANDASIGLHKRLGFSMTGTLRSVGFKCGRWVDTVLMQRELARISHQNRF